MTIWYWNHYGKVSPYQHINFDTAYLYNVTLSNLDILSLHTIIFVYFKTVQSTLSYDITLWYWMFVHLKHILIL